MAKKRSRSSLSKRIGQAGGSRAGNVIPLSILEKRARKLNKIVIQRGGSI